MFKSNSKKILEAQMSLIDTQIVNIQTEMLETLSYVLNLLGDLKIPEARSYIVGILGWSDLLKKQAKTYITQSILKIFETDAKLSYTIEDIEAKKNKVFEWSDEIVQTTKQFQNTLKTTNNPKEIYDDYHRLLEKIGYDERFTDFVNTLKMLVLEYSIYLTGKPKNKLIFIFENLNLHPKIKKASKKLFEDEHYAQAILEAYKALNNHVKNKSKRKDLDGKDLMSKVFRFSYNKETDQVERKPILQLNELNEQSDRDEQDGFMLLFMGSIQGIRNPKAHDIIIQNDPYRTLQYLSLASLLAKRVDEAKLLRVWG